MVLALAPPALAADLDILRGSQPIVPLTPVAAPVMTVGPATFTRWSGFYVGGDFSYNYSQCRLFPRDAAARGVQPASLTVEEVVHPSDLPLLGKGIANAFGVGGFLGYNTQWQDLILGVEATYTHTNLNMTASSSPVAGTSTSPSRVFSRGGASYNVDLFGNGNLDLTDYAEYAAAPDMSSATCCRTASSALRSGRASYSVTTLANVTAEHRSVPPFLVHVTQPPMCQSFSFSNSAGQSNALLCGFSVGGGLDWALTPNVFLRGEFEFIQFVPMQISRL